PVLIIGVAFLVLSVFIPKPYCRFVCPTGTLMKFAQKK
ncbi:MAG: 4Fe-4S binding protein, partial [Bacteroidales bacterium]|nr:4Fe-4S binding protein [Bacteroidales bacterium]